MEVDMHEYINRYLLEPVLMKSNSGLCENKTKNTN